MTASQPGSAAHRAASRLPDPVRAAVLFVASLALLLAIVEAFSRQPWSMLDLRVYLWGGALVRHSQDPYLRSYLRLGLHFTYTPMAAALFTLATLISLPVVKVLTAAAGVASLVAVIWLTWGALGRRHRRLGATLAVAAVALWLEPVRLTLSLGQINLVLMLVIVADLVQPDARWHKGAGVGLAAGVKLTPLIFIAYLLLTRRPRAAAVAAGTFVLTIGVSLVLTPAAGEQYWLDGLFLNAQRIGNVRYVGNQSLYGALARLTGSAAAAQPYEVAAVAVVGAAGLAVAAWAARLGRDMTGILACALTGLLVSPVSWTHHWVWAIPALVVLADAAARPPGPAGSRWRRIRWLGVATVVAAFSGVLWLVPAGGAQGRIAVLPEQLLADLYVLAGLAGLAVIATMLARARRQVSGATPAATLVAASQVMRPGSRSQPEAGR